VVIKMDYANVENDVFGPKGTFSVKFGIYVHQTTIFKGGIR
jgi:hypothetical protein